MDNLSIAEAIMASTSNTLRVLEVELRRLRTLTAVTAWRSRSLRRRCAMARRMAELRAAKR